MIFLVLSSFRSLLVLFLSGICWRCARWRLKDAFQLHTFCIWGIVPTESTLLALRRWGDKSPLMGEILYLSNKRSKDSPWGQSSSLSCSGFWLRGWHESRHGESSHGLPGGEAIMRTLKWLHLMHLPLIPMLG